MSDSDTEFRNILVLNFGQLGDVIISLPALAAVRQKFPQAKITIMCGKAVAEIIKLSGFSDEVIVVDRVKLRDSAKLWSIKEIFKLIGDVRRRRFDFVIDVHSLSETNLLGYLSGAKKRLYAKRGSRSLDFLSNFQPAAPDFDENKHVGERYFDVLKPLQITKAERIVKINPHRHDLEFIDKLWNKNGLKESVVGLFPGAGHPARRWSLQKFSTLAEMLIKNNEVQIAVFLGPEEKSLRTEVEKLFPERTVIIDNLTLLQFIAALTKLAVFVSNDTGPAHMSAALGTPLIMLLQRSDFENYHFTPLSKHFKLLGRDVIDEIEPESVYQAVKELIKETAGK